MKAQTVIGVLAAAAATLAWWFNGSEPAGDRVAEATPARPVSQRDAPAAPALSTAIPAGEAPSATSTPSAKGDAPPPPRSAVLALVKAPNAATPDRALWDAARRLQLEPQMADDLAEVVLQPGATPAGRALAMDLLAQAGHPQAQRALVRVLADPRLAQRAPAAERGLLVQRLGFVNDALPEVVAQAEALAAAAEPAVRRAAVAAAGGLARRLATEGRAGEADGLLARAVRPAPQDAVEDVAARLLGLGNAGRTADTPELLGATRDARAPVRRAAARGLATHPTPGATARLGELVADPDLTVQRAALQSLGARATLPAPVLDGLAHAVRARRVAPLNHAALVNVLAPHVHQPAARQALQGTLAVADDDAALRGRIRSLLR